jgi:peptide/nickel transport system substrate-binding protein
VVETAGESTLEVDVLGLIRDHFREVGVAIYIRTTQRDVFRSRALGGQVQMGVWQGLDNAVPTADMSPEPLAPTAGEQLQWPAWGIWYASGESAGTAPDLPEAAELVALFETWRQTTTTEERAAIWHRMLAIRADQVFTIGTVSGALQPILYAKALRNVPEKALYGFEPTSYFGAYLPDTFFFAEG